MSDFILPEELMMKIWLRLPIKSTVRFRCVSNSWCASFSDPQFIYRNLTFFVAENQNEEDLLLVLDNREYYSVVSHEDSVIVSFDMSSEIFSTTSIPQIPDDKIIDRICKLKDGSMLFVACTDDEGGCAYDLWALLEVGVSPSFTKLFDIDWHCGNELVSPLGFWRNELVFGFNWERLIISDPSSKQEPKEVEIDKPLETVSCLVWTRGKNSVALT